MKTQLNHTALNVKEFDWYLNFFQEVFSMDIEKERGASPNRQVWFVQGIQLNESAKDGTSVGLYDHLGFAVEDVAALKEISIQHGCRPIEDKDHWFMLPNGVQIELKPINKF